MPKNLELTTSADPIPEVLQEIPCQHGRSAMRGSLANLSLVATLLTLAGCSQSEPVTPGEIALVFVEMTDTEATFTLSNGFDETISFRGARTLSFAIQTWPGDTGINCVSKPSFGVEEQLPGFAHGGDPTIFDVSPGQSVRLVVATSMPWRHKGGTCQFRLVMRNESIVESTEFHP